MNDISWERKGLALLLEKYPKATPIFITRNDSWLSVDLYIKRRVHKFAIWRATGCVYELDSNGAVGDDPILIPEGSPYLNKN